MFGQPRQLDAAQACLASLEEHGVRRNPPTSELHRLGELDLLVRLDGVKEGKAILDTVGVAEQAQPADPVRR